MVLQSQPYGSDVHQFPPYAGICDTLLRYKACPHLQCVPSSPCCVDHYSGSVLAPRPPNSHHHHHHPLPPSPHTFRHPPQSKTKPPNSDRPNKKINQCPITEHKRRKNAQIPPFLPRRNIQRGQILCPIPELTIPTCSTHRLGIGEVANPEPLPHKATGVVPTRPIWRGVKESEFSLRAHDRHSGKGGGEDSADPVG